MKNLSEQLSFRESMKEADVTSRLNKDEKSIWKSLDVASKRKYIELYKKDKNLFLESFQEKMQETNPEYENEFLKVNNEILDKFFLKQGINNPTSTTKNAFTKQRFDASFDRFMNGLGSISMSLERQAMFTYYSTQQKQNFIEIAQNDTLIKQNNDLLNQNHKLLQQNDEIIELLKQIANK
ncbi:hypothetical protein QTA71_10595 [Staphylococcus haemolyticus]|uniref:hypothetical protein n=1 Tax=Staphylococcus haemolyticus TaxID=1283 RepID=UPI00285DEA13|nr:hypothetical protein [Staphylococcus haemolyticus]MDR5622391.1 hypothetical protein [Staphylococcus haemolyticus]